MPDKYNVIDKRKQNQTCKNNAGKKEQRFGVILTPLSSSKCLLINCQKRFSG